MGNIAKMANARFQTNGVDLLIDGLSAAGETAGDIRERLWQVAWARGYQDVVVPIQVPDAKIEGFSVLTHQFSKQKTLVCVDDGEQLIGIIHDLESPPLGAKVRVLPLYGTSAHWTIKTLVSLGCGLNIRFDDNHVESAWVDRLKACLTQIREGEVAVRRQVEIDRRNIVFVTPPTPFRVEMEQADKEIRDRVTGGGYTDEEMKALARAKNNQAEADKVVARRNQRLIEAYREEVVTFRAQIPELRAAFDKKMEKYSEFRNQIDRCNAVDGTSRAITDATLRATQQLKTIEQAALNIHAPDIDRVEENPRRSYTEIIQTCDLLFELLPKRLQKPAATGAH
jgi:hypothetical protein